MTHPRFHRVRELFERALDLEVAARPAFVARESGGDLELEREVSRLLEVHESSSGFLAPPSETRVVETAERGAELAPNTRVGGYRVVRLLGTGGMGRVYLAQQERPHRRIALKLLRRAFGVSDGVRRFELEAQILARLSHPNIAQLYELGTWGEGASATPYFALEYVEEALDLVAFANERALPRRARVELLAQVCDAVQHAHQRGVIHRDLKPGNVLVDARGRPKVIDFGVARVFGQELAASIGTLGGEALGTLAYASPEQLSGDAADIDVRTDVYALGVLLYELCAGRTPFDVVERRIADIVDEIRHRDPPAPSRIAPEVERELDWIALRCLAKDRSRRYGSAEALANDLRAFLAGQTVAAGPDRWSYRVSKFVRRHRLAVASAALVSASLVGGITSTSVSLARAREAHEQEARAAASARLELGRKQRVLAAVRRILGASAPSREGVDVTLYELLEKERPRLETEFADDPELRTELADFLSSTYYDLGLVQESAELLEIALAGAQRSPSAAPRGEIARMKLMLARLRTYQSRFDEARELYESVEPLAPDLDPEVRVAALRMRAEVAARDGDLVVAVDHYRDAAEVSERELGAAHEVTLVVQSDLAAMLGGIGQLEEAECWAFKSCENAAATWGLEHLESQPPLLRLGALLQQRGRLWEALAIQEAQLPRLIAFFGPDHRNTLQAEQVLANTLAALGRFDDALVHARRALEIFQNAYPDDVEAELAARLALANLLASTGPFEEYLEQVEAALKAQLERGAPVHPTRVILELRLTKVLLDAGRHDEAETHARAALDTAENVYPPGHPMPSTCRVRIGIALAGQQRVDEALEQLDRGVDGLAGVREPSHLRVLREGLAMLVTLHSARNDEAARSARASQLEELALGP
ncbi:MAG: serine/threonine protein kinase [Planctomycetes bacterium]|nr:serine/threonine protein kinase [Planctomycetota bacterium]